MTVNATLLCELVVFSLFLLGVYKEVWPRFDAVLQKRRSIIAKGLEDAAKSAKDLDEAHEKAANFIAQAHEKAKVIVEQAYQHGQVIKDRAHDEAAEIKRRLIQEAHQEQEKMSQVFYQEAKTHYADIIDLALRSIFDKDSNFDFSGFVNKALVQIERQ